MKILVTADIHIHDFRTHNLFGDKLFRLNQFTALADRIREVISDEGCEAVIIAGDLLHVASPFPYVTNAAFNFLASLSPTKVYLTHGQHDFDSRTRMSSDNTLLSLTSHVKNVSYLHREGLKLGGRKFYFQGWTEEQEFNVLPGEYDVLIGHATISNSIVDQFGYQLGKAQDIPSEYFKLCFIGDIHKHQVIGNIVIPGPPVQNRVSDHPDTGFIIFDTNSFTWYRVPVETPKHQFLKFVIGSHPNSNPYVVAQGKNLPEVKREQVHSNLDILQIIEKEVEKEGLQDIHSSILGRTNARSRYFVNHNFSVCTVEISNFRSIGHLKYRVCPGVTLIRGHTGAGKSSIIEAISFALLGNSRGQRSLVKKGTSSMEVIVELDYEGVTYCITRGWDSGGYLRLKINGEEIESENIQSTESKLQECFPFLPLFNSFARPQGSSRFLSGMGYSARTSLVGKVIGLDLLEALKELAEIDSKRVKEKIAGTNEKILVLEGSINELTSVDTSDLEGGYEEKLACKREELAPCLEMEDKQKKLESLRESLNHISVLSDSPLPEVQDIRALEKKRNENIALLQYSQREQNRIKGIIVNISMETGTVRGKISGLEKTIRKLSERIKEISNSDVCFFCEQSLNPSSKEHLVSALNSERRNIEDSIANELSLIHVLTERVKKEEEVVKGLETEIGVYTKQVSDLDTEIHTANTRREDKERILEARKTKKELEGRILKILEELGTWKNITPEMKSKIEEEIDYLASKVSRLAHLREIQAKLQRKRGEISSLRSKKSESEEENKRLEQYAKLVSPKGPISWSILNRVSGIMSNDKFEVVAYKKKVSGGISPDFSVKMRIDSLSIEYDNLSGGQKIICDIFVMKSLLEILGGIGLLTLDETFGELDSSSLEEAMELIGSINSTAILLVSHEFNFPYYDQLITAELKGNQSEFLMTS